MLAMLSCVFSEPLAKDGTSNAETRMSQPQTPLSMKTPAFSLDYFPSNAAAWSMYQRTPINSVVLTPKLAQTPSGLYGSLGSSNGPWGSDPASTSYSCGETPPLRSNRGSSEHLNQQTQSLSTSPEGVRGVRRVNSRLASSFAASLSRPFSTTASSSPPNPPSINRKRPSPVENMLSSLAPSAITWGNTTVLGSVKELIAPDQLSYSDDESVQDEEKLTICTGISLTIANQNAFDDEGCMSASLLDPASSALFVGYRRAYAELLYSWDHPLARLEVLKFNGLKEYFVEVDIPDNRSFAASILSNESHTLSHEPSPSMPILLGKRDHPHTSATPLIAEQGLDVTGYCLIHESRLEPLINDTAGGAVGRCDRCKAVQHQLRCTVCMEPISALFPPCLSCGCAAHQHCLVDYHASGGTSCPGGCDCDCSRKASEGAVESWEVMMGAIEHMRRLNSRSGEKAKEKLDEWDAGDKGDWERIRVHDAGLGRGYSTLSRRSRQGDLAKGAAKKKTSSLMEEKLL